MADILRSCKVRRNVKKTRLIQHSTHVLQKSIQEKTSRLKASLRTVAPIANTHIFCASRDSCMCSGAKNFRCIELLFLYFASVVGVLTRKWGT